MVIEEKSLEYFQAEAITTLDVRETVVEVVVLEEQEDGDNEPPS